MKYLKVIRFCLKSYAWSVILSDSGMHGEKLLDDHTLVALTIMIAESRSEEKEMMINVIMNCIG